MIASNPDMDKVRFTVLDSFRGLCAVFVVLFHLRVENSITELYFFRNSGLFVEFFFVLSGFVLMHSYGCGNRKLMNVSQLNAFFVTRTFRIFPTHLAILGLFLLLETAKLLATYKGVSFNNPPFEGAYSPSELPANIFLLQAWLGNFLTHSFNGPSWSLSVEYYVYILFGVLLICARNFAAYIFFFVFAASFLALLYEASFLKQEIFRGVGGFFFGTLTYLIFLIVHKRVKLEAYAWSILEVISIALVFISVGLDRRIFFSNITLNAFVVFCFAIVVFAKEGGLLSKLFVKQPFIAIGKLSYSIYMTHAFVIVSLSIVSIAISKFVSIANAKIPRYGYMPIEAGGKVAALGDYVYGNMLALLLLGAVIFASVIIHKNIELPWMQLGKRVSKKLFLR